ncbi:MAG: SUMF1/EgtB/PvdO family nonheme iron enzyme [Sandaracinaceae bacterium]
MRALAILILLAGCDAATTSDAGRSMMDAGSPVAADGGGADADARLDAGGMDGGAIDAGAGPAIDGGGTPCVVAGTAGECIHVDDCTGMSTPGFCPGPSEIQCCTPVASGSCDPSVMPTPNAGAMEAPGSGGCPPGMTRVASFCIDVYEASLVVVGPSGPIASWSPYHNPGSNRVRAISAAGAVPQGYINQIQATAACDEAGKRLCTDAEWLRACRGPSGSVYPYGDTRMPGVCNDARAVHPAVERFMSSEPWVFSMLGDACINQLPDSVALTGAHPGCVSAEGPLDMMGNLHEWTADPAGTFRGGYYVDTYRNGEGCLYRTTAHTTPHWDYSTGFRCCADP